jgi:asparagine synthase (glutamine-hydrolysing)
MGSFGPALSPYTSQILKVTDRLPSRSLGIFNVARRLAKLAESAPLEAPASYLSWFEIFSGDERRSLVGDGPDGALARFESMFAEASDLRLDPVQTLQYVDVQTMLIDNLLMKADKISMAHSLEVRVPFMSRHLVEFGLGLPSRQKIGPLRDKRLVRRLLGPELGARIANRPKRGFEIPVDRWFREPAAEPIRERLKTGALVSTLDFDPRALGALIERHLGGEDIGRKLFALTALEQWVQKFA